MVGVVVALVVVAVVQGQAIDGLRTDVAEIEQAGLPYTDGAATTSAVSQPLLERELSKLRRDVSRLTTSVAGLQEDAAAYAGGQGVAIEGRLDMAEGRLIQVRTALDELTGVIDSLRRAIEDGGVAHDLLADCVGWVMAELEAMQPGHDYPYFPPNGCRRLR